MRFSANFENEKLEQIRSEAKELVAKRVKRISITGSGPYSEKDFGRLALVLGISARGLDKQSYRVVVGREKWDKESLLEIIDARKGKHLKVYSQKMFIEFLKTGTDPFEDKHRLRKWTDHPVLKFLSEIGFDWPTTQITTGPKVNDRLDHNNWIDEGLLRHKGYRVGKNGLPADQRREILALLFETKDLPRLKYAEYVREWGEARSSKRLQKMANSIATFCRNAKRRSVDNNKAIAEWESDLNWLKSNFYSARFRFQWPNTKIK